MVKGNQSIYLDMCIKLGKIRGLSNQGTELKLRSQTNKQKRVQRRSWDWRNTETTEGTKKAAEVAASASGPKEEEDWDADVTPPPCPPAP